MSYMFFETHKTYPSEKNGTITVWRDFIFSPWQIAVAGCGQTSVYTNRMWKQTTKHLAEKSSEIQSILIGGLGGGGHIPILKKFFPGCDITIVEHDPVMVRVALEHGLYTPDARTHVIEGDMFAVLATLPGAFDLVCVDLFTGEDPSPTTTTNASIDLLRAKLSPRGFLVVNAYQRGDYLDILRPHFVHTELLHYYNNHLAIYWDHETVG